MDGILRLFPFPAGEIPLEGAYLRHDLRRVSEKTGRPFVYANFIASLDGRIAVPPPGEMELSVPKSLSNPRDWRLYQELAAQADLILSSGRYLREWAAGRAGELLQVDDPSFADLRAWREEHGLKPNADIAIISASLDFNIPDVLMSGERRLVVVTVSHADPRRVSEIESRGIRVIAAGNASVDGAEMLRQLGELGYRTIYSAAGPRVLHALVTGRALGRLYLTFANRLLGSQDFASVLEGTAVQPPAGLRLSSLYLDPAGLDGLGQLFAAYDLLVFNHRQT